MQQPRLTFLIENENFPGVIKPLVDSVGEQVANINGWLEGSIGSGAEKEYRRLLENTAKLEWMKLKGNNADLVRYGLSGSNFWISVLNTKNQWQRIAVVLFENFKS